MILEKSNILGLVLAGGQARRMGGGDKCLLPLGDRPLLQHAIDRAGPQVSELVLSANGDPGRFAAFGLEVLADVIEDFAGPLAGVLTGMEWAARHRPHITWMASFASDTPYFPKSLVADLASAMSAQEAMLAGAASAGRDHPVFGLWPVALRHDLRRALSEEGIHKVAAWTERYTLARVVYNDDPVDPFFNINRPEDITVASRYLNRESTEKIRPA